MRFLMTAATLLAGLSMILVRRGEITRSVQAQDLSVIGQWSSPQAWPVVAVHDHMLPTGKVLFYTYSDEAWLWDPATAGLTPAARAGFNIFCSGHSFLPDGRLLVAGGHIANSVGLPNAAIYDPAQDSWVRLPNMNAGRWYPTNTTLANGDVLVVSGDVDTTQGVNRLPQVWQAATGEWRDLTGAQLALPLYPYMHLAPNGRVFAAGPSQTTRYLDTSGSGSWSFVANSNYGYRDYGSSVLYEDGKVLIVGGGDPPTNTAELIDLNAGTPAWRYVTPMAYKRRQINATLLPDGTVLVTGGSSSAGFNNQGGAVYAGELWDPVSETWTTVASFTQYRGYHSFTLLLPDGRVLSGGGDGHSSAEVYSPGYLFKGARPVITSAPSIVTYGQSFFVGTDDAAQITRVSLVRLSSVTHAFNMDQRINRLAILSVAQGGLNVAGPTNANLSPTGYYMLFLLNSSGVPSEAKMVRVDAAPPTPPPAPSDLRATPRSASRIDLNWTDNAANEEGFRIERCKGVTCTDFAEIAQTSPNATAYSDMGLEAVTAYSYRVRAFNAGGLSAYSDPATTTTLIPLPPPLDLTATAVSSSRIELAWTDASVDETGFTIERCQGSGCADFSQIVQVAAGVTSYANTGLPANTTFSYRIRAFNEGGESGYSNTATATTHPTAVPPAAPTNLTAVPGPSTRQIDLAWVDNSTNETGFRIERCRKAGCTKFSQIVEVPADVKTFRDTGVISRHTYRYRVRAYNGAGNSPYSNIASAQAR